MEQNWIPCSERCPEENGTYITMIAGASKATALKFAKRRDGKDNVWFDDWLIQTVTHWMPMPDPPKE